MKYIEDFFHFIRDHFDKILMSFFVLQAEILVLFLYLHKAPIEVMSWGMELTTGFVGALLGLVTGIAIGKGMSKKEVISETVSKVKTDESQ